MTLAGRAQHIYRSVKRKEENYGKTTRYCEEHLQESICAEGSQHKNKLFKRIFTAALKLKI